MKLPHAASFLLASLTITACVTSGPGTDEDEPAEPCPATGAPLLPQLPRVQPIYTDGCEDSTWASDVEAEVTWTIELGSSTQNASMVVVPSVDGVVAITDRTARWVTSEGEVVSQRDLGGTTIWSRVQGSTNGQLVVAGSTVGAPFYRVLDANGGQLWLRLLDPGFGVPSILLDGSDLLVGTQEFAEDVVLRIDRWALTGSKKGSLTLATYGDSFVRDGVGRYAVIADWTMEVFDAEGTLLGAVPVGIGEYPSVFQFVGADDGFYLAGGERDAFISRITVGSTVEVAWTYTLGDPSSEWEYATSLAVLPEGGVVVVGGEDKIRVTSPMSPLVGTTQPFVLALDPEGEPMWGERIGVPGRAVAVGIGAQGEVYVAGTAQGGPPGSPAASWLRRYDPE
jgi:hypothetical protein